MSRPLDRRLLVSLDRKAWDSVTAAVLGRINDQVLARAVRTLPPSCEV